MGFIVFVLSLVLVFVKVNFKLISVSNMFKFACQMSPTLLHLQGPTDQTDSFEGEVFYVFLPNLDQQSKSGLKYVK